MASSFDFETSQVQKELIGSSFVKGETTIIAAGPPYLNYMGLVDYGILGSNNNFTFDGSPDESSAFRGAARLGAVPIFPIGVIENANLSSVKQLRRIAEVGSKRFHFVNGRTINQLSIARVLFHGPSLLRVLYAYVDKRRFETGGKFGQLLESADLLYDEIDDTKVVHTPGYADFFTNLDSNLFDIPFGLMIYMEDSKGNPYGAFYCSESYIQTHQMSIGASATIIAEAVTVQFDRVIPIDIGAIPIAGTPRV